MHQTPIFHFCLSPLDSPYLSLSLMDPPELHVLAVDDSNVDRKVIQKLLQISSFKVTVVESGSRALQYLGLDQGKNSDCFGDLKVNLIMTDYSMPGMTGFELLKKIKESSTLREIPVVIMSSENSLTRIDRCLEEGAEDYLLKPVKLSDLRRLKDTILKTGSQLTGQTLTRKRKHNSDQSPKPVYHDQTLSPLSSPQQAETKRARL